METCRKHLKIQGKVQGVGFRHNAFLLAQKLGLKGWVKNTQTGDVEIIVEGKDKDVRLFLEWCHEGPIHSVVTTVTVLKSEQAIEQQYSEFTIKKTT